MLNSKQPLTALVSLILLIIGTPHSFADLREVSSPPSLSGPPRAVGQPMLVVHQFVRSGSTIIQISGLLDSTGRFTKLSQQRGWIVRDSRLLEKGSYWIEAEKVDLLRSLLPKLELAFRISKQGDRWRSLAWLRVEIVTTERPPVPTS